MFSYYGAKTKIVDKYPMPKWDKIIEPFAGSARYALKYFEREITLYEIYPKVFAIWEYLIKATPNDILSLPDLTIGDDVRNIKSLSDVERWLMGYQIQRGSARPGCIVNKRCRWNTDKIRIASELYKIKHWKILNESGMTHTWENATYFVDPPYTVQKHGYNCKYVDYELLKNKVDNAKKGQFIVCGNMDDKWAPFEPLCSMHGINKTHVECLWIKE